MGSVHLPLLAKEYFYEVLLKLANSLLNSTDKYATEQELDQHTDSYIIPPTPIHLVLGLYYYKSLESSLTISSLTSGHEIIIKKHQYIMCKHCYKRRNWLLQPVSSSAT